MQDSDKKKHTHTESAESVKSSSEAKERVIRADSDLYGDEVEINLRARKKSVSAKKKKKKKRSSSNRPSLLKRIDLLTEPRHFRKRRTLFETLSASRDAEGYFKPITIWGKEIRFWPLILLMIIFLVIAVIFMNNNNVRVAEERVTIVGLHPDLEDYKILVISDLHGRRFGDEQSSLLRTIGNLNYNAVFFTGDMIGADGDPEPFYELLEGIPSSKKVFFICGDSDPGPFVKVPRAISDTLTNIVLEDWILGAIERGATYVDAPVTLTIGDATVWITPYTLTNYQSSELLETWKGQTQQEEEGLLAGLESDYQNYPFTSYRYRIAQKLYDSIAVMSDDDLYISMAHEPPTDDFVYSVASHKNDPGKYLHEPELLLAGHYCGGVWRLPLLGAFYVPDDMLPRNGWFPSQGKVNGLSTIGESQLYVTGGLSTNPDTPLLFFRLGNQPEISLLTLSATLPESMLTIE